MRHITEAGLCLIKTYEGFVDHIYLCQAGVRTIGYGHAVRPWETFDEPIDESQGLELLAKDVQSAESAVLRLLPVELTDGQFNALVSFTFNLGSGALQRSTLRSMILRGEFGSAVDEFPKWIWAGGQRSKGLLRRRIAEREIFLT